MCAHRYQRLANTNKWKLRGYESAASSELCTLDCVRDVLCFPGTKDRRCKGEDWVNLRLRWLKETEQPFEEKQDESKGEASKKTKGQ